MFFEGWVYGLFCHLTRGYVQRVRVRPDIFLYRLTVGTAPSHLSQGWRISLIIRREGDGVVGPHWLVLVLFFFFFFNQHVQEPVPILLCRSARRLVAFRYRPSLSLALISNFHFLYFGRSWSLSLRVFFVFCCFIICFIPNAQSSKTVIDCTRSSVGHRSIQQFPHRDEPNREFSFSFLPASFYTHAHNWRVRRDLLPWWIVFDTYRRQINKNTATDAMKRNSNFHFCFLFSSVHQ